MALFKNIIVFRLAADSQIPESTALETVLQRTQFEPCHPRQELSAGWVSPRGEEHAPMLESIDGQWMLKLAVERKAVPASAVKAALEEKIKELTEQRGRAPGRKEKKELKEEVYFELLPRAFSKRSATLLWVDAKGGFLVVGTGSARGADLVVDALVQAVAEAGGALKLSPLMTEMSPSAAMSDWLITQEDPSGFTTDQDLELKDPDTKATVRYAKHSLALEEIGKHISEGKLPTQLAMTWDGRVSFVLTSALILKRIETLESVFEDKGRPEDFDGNVALATGELSQVLPALIEALGGEKVQAAAGDDADGAEDGADA